MYVRKTETGVVRYAGPQMGAAWMAANGWMAYTGRLPPDRLSIVDGAVVELPEPSVPAGPIRLSKLAIIRALGDAWPEKKAEIEAAGLWDQWSAAAWLDTADPAFAGWWAALSDDERRMLIANCQY